MHLQWIIILICIWIELGIGEHQTPGVFHNQVKTGKSELNQYGKHSKLCLNFQFAVHIPGGHEAADKVASRHDFMNLGQIGSLENYFLFEHPRITKRSLTISHKHHQKLKDDPEVGWFEQQKELVRSKRDLSQEIEITDPMFK